jgi:hypothetical protein
MVAPALARTWLEDREYWHAAATFPAPPPRSAAYLLPNFDEYVVAYRDRSPIIVQNGQNGRGRPSGFMTPSSSDVLGYVLVIDGRVAGTWKRILQADTVSIDVRLYRSLTHVETRFLTRAAERYGRFLNLPIALTTARVRA